MANDAPDEQMQNLQKVLMRTYLRSYRALLHGCGVREPKLSKEVHELWESVRNLDPMKWPHYTDHI